MDSDGCGRGSCSEVWEKLSVMRKPADLRPSCAYVTHLPFKITAPNFFALNVFGLATRIIAYAIRDLLLSRSECDHETALCGTVGLPSAQSCPRLKQLDATASVEYDDLGDMGVHQQQVVLTNR